MIRLIFERVLGLIAVLIAGSAIIFFLGSLIPGDIVTVIVGANGASKEATEALREQLGLNQPLILQYLHWLLGVLRGDFGTSPITGRSVTTDIVNQFPITMELTLLGIAVSTLIGVPVGVLAATRAGKWSDFILRSSLLFFFSIPIFVVGVLLLLLVSIYFPEFYSVGFVPFEQDPLGNLQSMFLPTLSIALPVSAMTMQMTRASMLEALASPYITLARAKGARNRAVFYIHALKNAFSPVLTQLGFTFGILVGGLFVVETIFNLPGLGRGLLTAIGQRDYPMVMADAMVLATVFVVTNTIVDLLYPVFDPRQRSTR
jgi:peptide/nickel transport system permease protein